MGFIAQKMHPPSRMTECWGPRPAVGGHGEMAAALVPANLLLPPVSSFRPTSSRGFRLCSKELTLFYKLAPIQLSLYELKDTPEIKVRSLGVGLPYRQKTCEPCCVRLTRSSPTVAEACLRLPSHNPHHQQCSRKAQAQAALPGQEFAIFSILLAKLPYLLIFAGGSLGRSSAA